jgi:hypothetical protein
MSQALVLAVGAAEETHPLPMSPVMFPIIAIIVFIALLGLVWTFRGYSNKHH